MALLSKQDKIFIAGHKGLVGSALLRKLTELGFQNILTYSRQELDLLDTHAVNNFFKAERPDVVFLAAAKVGGIHANNVYRADFIFENLQIQNNVVWNAHIHNTHRLIFLGSSCIYPKECPQPMKEEYLLGGKLEVTNQPYAIAKIAGIELVNSLRKQYSRDYFCIMPTNLFGPNDNFHPENSHVLPALIRKFCEAKEKNLPFVTIWGDGSPLREFMYSDDLADAVCFLASHVSFNDLNKSEVGQKDLCHINAGTGEEITIRDLARTIAKIVEYQGDIVFDASKPNGTLRKLMDSTVLMHFGWKPRLNFEDSIRTVAKIFLEKYPY